VYVSGENKQFYFSWLENNADQDNGNRIKEKVRLGRMVVACTTSKE
jgi:hypothetical protein